MNRSILLIIFLILFSPSYLLGAITSLKVIEKEGVTTNNYPLTFGHVFREGDVTSFAKVVYNSSPLETQCDVKSTYQDGSVKFAVISVILPSVAANSTNILALENSTTHASTGHLDKASILQTKIEDEIRLSNISGSGYSGSLTGDLNQAISNSSFSYWLKGGVVTEILVDQNLNPSLDAVWEARFYPGTSFGPRISHSIENVNAEYRGQVQYAVDIQAGTPTLNSLYTKSTFVHFKTARWRKVLWVGAEPPETELHYDIHYLISTGAIMNYDTSLSPSEATLYGRYAAWERSNRDIMGNGVIEKIMPMVGGRPDLGILPRWTVDYLLTMDNRAKKIMLNAGEMAGSCPIHYREGDPSKSFFGHPISIKDRPTVWTTPYNNRETSFGRPEDNLPPRLGSDIVGSGWNIDRNHQPSLAFVPYLITGERFFLDELYYWAAWNISETTYNPDYGRKYDTGFIRNEVRGDAWTFRTLVDAAAFAVDSDPEKNYFLELIDANITNWTAKGNTYPLKWWNVSGIYSDPAFPSSINRVVSPWMENFVVLALSHAKELGFNTSPVLDWLSQFTIDTHTHPDLTPATGFAYHMPGRYTDGSYPQTWKEFASLFLNGLPTGAPEADYPYSYRYIARAATSTLTGYPNGQKAYDYIDNVIADKYKMNDDATWAIIPRTENVSYHRGWKIWWFLHFPMQKN